MTTPGTSAVIGPTVALIHATPTAIAPAAAGFGAAFPEAELWNVLDDRLVSDAVRTGVTSALRNRMLRLVDHVVRSGADAVLMTCSMYGSVRPLAEELHCLPVLAADDALFEAVLRASPRRGLLVGSLGSAVDDSLVRFHSYAWEHGSSLRLLGHLLAASGDVESVVEDILAAMGRPGWPDGAPDTVVLAQYSLAPAASAIAAALGVPVLSGPELAARSLQALLQQRSTPGAVG
ncbi:MAG TPA: aspartate/glutamate racemase family protein [Nocardioides sp.]|uniref:aspartate/glutamate racemase family protein n=1 Tax=Nocardioides sp. TaxID=35761 RepID=UPI002E31204C|nr:aspartate/glutamate racemase family protein [Nocardioides sp.]HEX3931794.1 aspartate/glutamate racemase family protein [Nocardioides sp.]